MSTIPARRLAARFLVAVLALAALPALGSAQEARLRIAGLVPEPLPISALTPALVHPQAALVSGPAPASPPPLREVAFHTAPGPYSTRLAQAVMQGSSFRTAVIELLRNGRVHETITLSDVRVTSVSQSAPGRGARDHVALSFGGMVRSSADGSGGRTRQPPSP